MCVTIIMRQMLDKGFSIMKKKVFENFCIAQFSFSNIWCASFSLSLHTLCPARRHWALIAAVRLRRCFMLSQKNRWRVDAAWRNNKTARRECCKKKKKLRGFVPTARTLPHCRNYDCSRWEKRELLQNTLGASFLTLRGFIFFTCHSKTKLLS